MFEKVPTAALTDDWQKYNTCYGDFVAINKSVSSHNDKRKTNKWTQYLLNLLFKS